MLVADFSDDSTRKFPLGTSGVKEGTTGPLFFMMFCLLEGRANHKFIDPLLCNYLGKQSYIALEKPC